MRKTTISGLLTVSVAVSMSVACADEILFVNGDRLTGELVEKTERTYIIRTDALGVIAVDQDNVIQFGPEPLPHEQDSPRTSASTANAPTPRFESLPKDVEWNRDITVGYNISSGNTESSEFSTAVRINRKTPKNETTLTGDTYVSESENEVDAQRYSASARYAYSFGKKKKWYHFFKGGYEHDRFSNVQARYIPSTGLGYWFSDTDQLKAMVEAAGGFVRTEFRDDTDRRGEMAAIPRAYIERKIWKEARVSVESTAFQSLGDTENLRIRSEATLTNPVTEHIALKLSFVDEYDASPAKEAERNDIRFMTSLQASL